MKRWLFMQWGNFVRWQLESVQRAAKSMDLVPEPEVPGGKGEANYVAPDPDITPEVLMASFWEPSDQAELNALMESLRKTGQIQMASIAMLGQLSIHYGQEEALVRVLANATMLGMKIERRLTK